jgi:diguanylate cyclase (GGDEF)-like protein/PAS domain S-box-containing protein
MGEISTPPDRPCRSARPTEPGGAHVQQNYGILLDHLPDAVLVYRLGRIVYLNDAATGWLRPSSADELIGRPVADFFPAESLAILYDRSATLQALGDHTSPMRLILQPSTGNLLDVEARLVFTNWNGAPATLVVLCGHARPEATDDDHFRSVVHSLEAGVIVIEPNGRIVSMNPAALDIIGTRNKRLPTDNTGYAMALDICDSDGRPLTAEEVPSQLTLHTRETTSGRVVGIRRPDGQQRWLSVSTHILDPTAARSSVVLSFSDITDQYLLGKRLTHAATHDPLTGLPNRAGVAARITALSEHEGLAAVMFIDLDDLKSINDSHGHSAGDAVLKVAATRLRRAVRAEDMVGRLGGDEFVALLAEPLGIDDAAGVAQRLHDVMSDRITIGARALRASVSIGVVMAAAGNVRSAEDILHAADVAMYDAKTSGKGQTRFFIAEPTD